MKKPIIGITSYRREVYIPTWKEVSSTLVPDSYLNAVLRAGGIPVVIPSVVENIETPNIMLSAIDGLIIIGGIDVNPSLYDQAPHPETGQWDDIRDKTELGLLKGALELKMPVLGICRGMQLLNIICGGTLHQHVPDVFGEKVPHQGPEGEDCFFYHNVEFEKETILGKKLGEEMLVPSSHHQAIDKLGEGLTISGIDNMGLIESVEYSDHPFCIGVQWHPEEDYKSNKKLFESFVSKALNFER